MSGHSKWATIKRDKGANDAKRGAAFTKLANAITVAVRQGRGLDLAIEKARAANMPKDNIQRAMDRGSKSTDSQLFESVYEGFGPGGVAIIVEAISDNNARTAAEIRSIFNKHGGNLGTPGSVSYLFTRVGQIENETFEKAIEIEALDFEDGTIYTKPEDLHRVSEILKKSGNLIFKPNKETMVETDVTDLLNALDNLDDVQNVYTNAA